MTLLGIGWLWWALGTFGLVGTALLLWLAPAALFEIVKALTTFFFTTRLGAAVLAASIAFFVADVNRSRRDEAEFAVRTAMFEQAQKDRDAKIAADTRASVEAEIAAQTARDAETDNQVKEFQDALTPVQATDPCSDIVRVGSNAARLRAISGEAVRRSSGIKRMPKARKKAAHP